VIVADLTPEQARTYRLVDNKTSELTSWDEEKLLDEFRAAAEADVEQFFADVQLWDEASPVTDDDVADAEASLANRFTDDGQQDSTDVTCPSCHHGFQVFLDGAAVGSGWSRTSTVVGAEMPSEAAAVVAQAIDRAQQDHQLDQPWRALEALAADYLAG
jgi:hypothetical protein